MYFKTLISIVTLFSLSLFPILVQGQDNATADFTMPTIVQTSPEAKGIGKYGDVPVSTYTGVPDISIPIYTVKAARREKKDLEEGKK